MVGDISSIVYQGLETASQAHTRQKGETPCIVCAYMYDAIF